MKNKVYIFVNGIMNNPGQSDNWTDRAVTWMHIHTAPDVIPAEKFEYFTGPLTRRLFQQYRSNKLARVLSFYFGADFDVVLVGHSNGCDIICRVLDMLTHPVKEVHLISPACHKPAYHNGLVEQLYVYIGGQDKAMKWAKLSEKLLGRWGLGYGSLGGISRTEAQRLFGVSNVNYEPAFGHSTWFEKGPLFDMTMSSILNPEGGSE